MGAPASMFPVYPDYKDRRQGTLNQPSIDEIDEKVLISASTCQWKESEPDHQVEGDSSTSSERGVTASDAVSASQTRQVRKLCRGSSRGSSSTVISTEKVLAALSTRSKRRSTTDTINTNKTIDLSASQKEGMVKVWNRYISTRPKQAIPFGVFFLRMFLNLPENKAVFPDVEKLKLQKLCSASHVRQTLDTIHIAVINMDNLASTLRVFRKTGARHFKYGVDSAEIVECFMAGVLHMLCKILDLNIPSSTKAWESVLNLIKAEFLLGMKRGMVSSGSVDVSFEDSSGIDILESSAFLSRTQKEN